MTVIEAARTENRTENPTPRMDAILASVRDSVWTLVRAGWVDAAVALLAPNAAAFFAAWREEEVGLPPAIEVGQIVPTDAYVELAATTGLAEKWTYVVTNVGTGNPGLRRRQAS